MNLLAYCDWLNRAMTELVGEDLGLEHCTMCDPQRAESWGQPCGTGYPTCPEHTICHSPPGYSDAGLGFCGPGCCTLNQTDRDYCTDISDGDEACALMNDSGDKYCAIRCDKSADCPQGTDCVKDEATICIAVQEGPEPTADRDAGADIDAGGGDNSGNSGCSATRLSGKRFSLFGSLFP